MCPLLTARRMKQHEKGQTYFWYLDRLQLFRLSSSRLNSYESKTWPMLSALEPLWEMTVEDGGVMSTHVSALTSQTISTEGIYRRKHSLATTVTWRSCDATGPTGQQRSQVSGAEIEPTPVWEEEELKRTFDAIFMLFLHNGSTVPFLMTGVDAFLFKW